jgi:hypothetical protein
MRKDQEYRFAVARKSEVREPDSSKIQYQTIMRKLRNKIQNNLIDTEADR